MSKNPVWHVNIYLRERGNGLTVKLAAPLSQTGNHRTTESTGLLDDLVKDVLAPQYVINCSWLKISHTSHIMWGEHCALLLHLSSVYIFVLYHLFKLHVSLLKCSLCQQTIYHGLGKVWSLFAFVVSIVLPWRSLCFIAHTHWPEFYTHNKWSCPNSSTRHHTDNSETTSSWCPPPNQQQWPCMTLCTRCGFSIFSLNLTLLSQVILFAV